MKKLLYLLILPITLFLISCGGGGSDDLQPIDPPVSLYTYIPDTCFEQRLIDDGYDNILDGVVLTTNINSITHYSINYSCVNNLSGIEDFTALTNLYCNDNQLTSLDVSNNTALTVLNCKSNQLTSLDISNNTALYYLECQHNDLTSLDVSNNTALDFLTCTHNDLTSLDVSNNIALTVLDCASNQLTSLDVNNNTALNYLECEENDLTSLDVSNNTNLRSLYCYNNQLSYLNVSNGNNYNWNISNSWNSTDNSLLECIEVDDASWSTANWTNIDPQQYFSEDCP